MDSLQEIRNLLQLPFQIGYDEALNQVEDGTKPEEVVICLTYDEALSLKRLLK